MKKPLASHQHIVTPLIIIFLGAALASGCAGIRKLTYPTNFVYVEQGEVTSLMHKLANSMSEMEKLVDMEDTTPATREKVLAELEKIEAETAFLAAAANPVETTEEQSGQFKVLRTNHLLLDEHIGDFLAEVANAKRQVMADPPNYFVVGQLTGGCNACHLQR